MKVLASLPCLLLMAGCADEDQLPNPELMTMFADVGVVPDCALVQQVVQAHIPEMSGYVASARYDGTDSCMEQWDDRLLAARYERHLPHREFLSQANPDVMVTEPLDGSRQVLLWNPAPFEAVQVVESIDD